MDQQIVGRHGKCPVQNKANGGLPPGGRFQPYTEYLVGAMRIAEAAHCILGSWHLGPEGEFDDHHVVEELELIERLLEEYSQDVYHKGRAWIYKSEEAKLATIEHIREHCPKLKARAKRLRQQVDLPNDYQQAFAEQTYVVVEELCQALLDSIETYPRIKNAYRNPALVEAVAMLRVRIKSWLNIVNLRPNPIIPRKGEKPALNFYGYDSGGFQESSEYLLAWRRYYDWEMITGLSSRNNWNIYHVEGATEHHVGFRQALCEIVEKYPELVDYLITFDGPPKKIAELLNPAVCIDWDKMEFLHGTSSVLLDPIFEKGLLPRDITGMPSTYGASTTRARPGRLDAIYLTTQMGMARFAAHDACRIHGGGLLILVVRGIDSCRAIPDVDSDELTAEMSLQRIGAIGYVGIIHPKLITVWREND